MRILISFIVPAYNVEPYLKECLDSIVRLNMRGQGWEIIVVNDGSTDGTAALLADYSKSHAEVSVITQENLGLSAARNVGMRHARGKYVCFVDSTFAVYLSTCFLMVFHIVLPASFWLIYAKKWAFPHLHSP